jgi:hypothetical protein
LRVDLWSLRPLHRATSKAQNEKQNRKFSQELPSSRSTTPC